MALWGQQLAMTTLSPSVCAHESHTTEWARPPLGHSWDSSAPFMRETFVSRTKRGRAGHTMLGPKASQTG